MSNALDTALVVLTWLIIFIVGGGAAYLFYYGAENKLKQKIIDTVNDYTKNDYPNNRDE